jgi:hypothetical protein
MRCQNVRIVGLPLGLALSRYVPCCLRICTDRVVRRGEMIVCIFCIETLSVTSPTVQMPRRQVASRYVCGAKEPRVTGILVPSTLHWIRLLVFCPKRSTTSLEIIVDDLLLWAVHEYYNCHIRVYIGYFICYNSCVLYSKLFVYIATEEKSNIKNYNVHIVARNITIHVRYLALPHVQGYSCKYIKLFPVELSVFYGSLIILWPLILSDIFLLFLSCHTSTKSSEVFLL